MDKSKKLRWAVLLSALTATVGAIFYPVDEPVQPLMALGLHLPAAMRPASASAIKDRARPIWVASDEDPFAPRVWDAPPASPPAEAARTVQTVELVQAAPAPPPQPLPYRFLGQMQDGGEHVLYLGRGDQVLLAHQGDVLEGSYKVLAVNDGMIEFESVQSGVKQTLPIPAQ